MTTEKRPGALTSARAEEIVLRGTLPFIIAAPNWQSHHTVAPRIIGWRVTRWLNVEAVEAQHG
jgi:hypothetical protein